MGQREIEAAVEAAIAEYVRNYGRNWNHLCGSQKKADQLADLILKGGWRTTYYEDPTKKGENP